MLDRANPPTPKFPGHIPLLKKIDQAPLTFIFSEVAIEDGKVQFEEVLKLFRTLGKMLQAVPQKERKAAVARLRNVADAHREKGHTPFTYLSIEALVNGWEDWANASDGVVGPTLSRR